MAEALDDHVVDDDAAVERYHHLIRRDAERLSVLVEDLRRILAVTASDARGSPSRRIWIHASRRWSR